MSSTGSARKVVPRFESLIGQKGLHVRDPIEDVQAVLYTDTDVSPRPTTTDDFVYPVDSAIEMTVTRLQTQFLTNIWVRSPEGDSVVEFNPGQGAVDIPQDDYLLEFNGMPMKMYGRVDETGFRIVPGEDSVDIFFDPDTRLRIGARSLHSQPAQTLTTTSDPEDLMEVISLFGNSMKTWSPERTYPSLRGHPPLLELDTRPDIPDHLGPPDTDIRLTIPADHDWLYPASSLAYWLGATVEPGNPALHVGSETYPLGVGEGYRAEPERKAFEQHVKDVLQFTFLLDCAVRPEGFYNVELDSRRRVDAAGLSLDYGALYDSSLAERVQTYMELDLSFEELAARIGRPGWRLTVDVQPDPERATIMPFLARDLAVVRCPTDGALADASEGGENTLDDFFRGGPSAGSGVTTGSGYDVATRSSSSSESPTVSREREQVINLPEADSMSQAWVGDGFAVGTAKASTTSYLQRLETRAEGSAGISIDVVVNDDEMADEASVSEIYGNRDILDFDIRVHDDLSTEELARMFERETNFIHYIGHVDPEGFDCSDGYLDAATLGTVGADTFVLNACASYEQGQRLIDRGAIAGVVTLEDVINSMATKIGKSIARLLNYGFPIGSATNLIQETMLTGSHYAVVGDSNAAIAQSKQAVPVVVRVGLRRDGRFDVSIETFASWNYDVGSNYRPYIEGCDCHYVVPGELDSWVVDDEALDAFIDRYTFPIVGARNLYWSDDVSAAPLRKRLQSYS